METTSRIDTSFGRMAVQLGHASQAQVHECLDVRAKMRAMGVDETLGIIIVKKGLLTAEQQRAILKALGVHTTPIPGYSILSKRYRTAERQSKGDADSVGRHRNASGERRAERKPREEERIGAGAGVRTEPDPAAG